jgi:hypothetical protein
MRKYAKAIAATLGAGVTAALGLAAPHTGLWNVLTVASALLTAASVFGVSNDRKPPVGVTGKYVGN